MRALGPGDYPEREHGQRRHRFRRFREKIRFRKRDALHPLGDERRARPHQLNLRAKPEHRRAQALGATRRPRRVHEPRGLAHLERLLRLRDSTRQNAEPTAAVVRRDHHDPERPRFHHGVERRRPTHHLRVEGRRAVRYPAELLAPALQRLRPRSGAFRLGDQRADRHQPLRGLGFHLRHQVRLQGPLQRRAGLFLRQGRNQGLHARHQFRSRRGQPAADHSQGARRRRRPHPLQLRQELAQQPHLAVPDRHLQKGARPRARRPCDHPVRRRLFADVAGGRQAALLQVGGRHHDRAAEHVAASALQHRHDAGALSRLQARGRRDPQRPGRAEGLDQQAAGRRPDRLLRREPGDAQGVSSASLPSTGSSRRWTRPTPPRRSISR